MPRAGSCGWGLEDDGTATGLHADQLNLAGLPALVAARTSPSLAVQVEAIEINGVPVARLVVPKARSVVATNGGVYPRRLKARGNLIQHGDRRATFYSVGNAAGH